MESQAVGQVVALTGKASLAIDGSSTPLEVGSPVYKGGVLTTEAESHIEVRFVDDTMLSQGPHSEVSIDDYVYDQADTASAILLDLTEGTLRTITGKIADENPEGFEVTTPLATLGIRGTDFSVIHTPDSGTKVVLNQISENHILIVTDQFGNVRYLNDPGTFVEAKEDEPISTVEVLSEEERKELLELTPFTTLPNDGFTEEAVPSDQAGEQETSDQEGDQTETEQQESETTTGLEIVAEGVGGAGPAEVQSALEALQTTIAEAGVESAEVMDALQVLESAIYEADGGIESQEVINALLVLESAIYEAASEEVITAFQTLESTIYEAVATAEQEALQEALSGTDEEQFDPSMLDNLPAPGAGGDPSETESELTGGIFDPTPEDPFTTPQSDPFTPQGSLYQPSSSLYDPVTGTTTLYGTTSTSSEPTTTTTSEQPSGTESTSEADSVLVSSTSDTGTTQPPQDPTQPSTTTPTGSGQTTTDSPPTDVVPLADTTPPAEEPVAPSGLTLVAGEGGEILIGGAGDDWLIGGLGPDSFYGGAGDDTIVILGGFDAGVYSDTPGGIDLYAGYPAYDTPDNVIDGGTGYDTLVSYGTANYTGVDITGIEEIQIHSDVIFTLDQFNSFNDLVALSGIGEGYHRVTFTTSDLGPGSLDLSNVTFTNIDEIVIDGEVTAVLTSDNLVGLGSGEIVTGTGTVTSSSVEEYLDLITYHSDQSGSDIVLAPIALTEFRVNTYIAHSQYSPSVTGLNGGGFVVVWESYGQDGSETGVFGQLYDASGNAVGSEFQVNTYTAGYQDRSSVTGLSDGGFVVTWDSYDQDGNVDGVYGQRYDSNGNSLGEEFLVTSYPSIGYFDSSVTGLADGGFVVTWDYWEQDGSEYGVYGQRYDSAGNAVGVEFGVNTYTTGNQVFSSVTGLTDGGFVVAWESDDGYEYGVFGQRYDLSGNKLGDEFSIYSIPSGGQIDSSVTGLADGGFVVTWHSYGLDGSRYGVFGQLYDSNGNVVGEEFQVNTYTTEDQVFSSVTGLNDGGFVVTWQSYNQDGSKYGVYGQRFDSVGNAVGSEFLINTYTANDQVFPSVTGLEDGGFVVTWESYNQDGSGYGIYGQRYDQYGQRIDINGNLILVADDEGRTLTGGTGDDALFGGLGVDSFYGDAGNDTIVIIGEFNSGVYRGILPGDTDLAAESPAYSPDAVIDGGTGHDTLLSYGTADYTGVEITSIEEINIHSDVTFTWDQFANFSDLLFLSGIGEEIHTVTLIVEEGDEIDLGGVTITNIDEIIIEGGGTVALSSENLDSLNSEIPVTGSGNITASTTEDLDNLIDYISINDVNFGEGIELVDADGNLLSTGKAVPVGQELQVNTYTTNDQFYPSVTGLVDGGYVVIWESYGQDDGESGIFGQRYTAAGNEAGLEFQINTYETGTQTYPRVASLVNGGFVVVWTSVGQDGGTGVYGQLFNSAGVANGDEIPVNISATNWQDDATVTGLNDGGFLVTWESDYQDGSESSIFGQRFDASGNTVGDEFQINTYTTYWQEEPQVITLSDGSLVVIWESYGADGSALAIRGQRYSSAGIAQGDEFQVNTFTAGNQSLPDIAALSDGGFVVTWQSEGQVGNYYEIYGQRYDSDGSKVGSEFQVNTNTEFYQEAPSVTGLDDGGFVVTWHSHDLQANSTGIYGQYFNSAGNKAGGEFQINTSMTGSEFIPSVTTLKDGSFVVAWQSEQEGVVDTEIFSQRFIIDQLGPEAPVDLYLTSTNLDENTTYVGTLSTLDPDTGFSYMDHSFSVSDTDNFQIVYNGNGAYDLEMVSPVDYETGITSYWINIEATGNDGLSYSEQFNITVNDVQDVVKTVTTENKISLGTMEYVYDLDTDLLSNGNYVVSWYGYGLDPANPGSYTYQTNAMIYGFDGTPLSDPSEPIQIIGGANYYGTGEIIEPLDGGGFFVTWEQYDNVSDKWSIQGRIYDNNGLITHNDFTVIADTSLLYSYRTTALANGDFVIGYTYYEDITWSRPDDIGYAKVFHPNNDGTVDPFTPFQLNQTGIDFTYLYEIGSYPISASNDTFIVQWWDGLSEYFFQGFSATDGLPLGHESTYLPTPIYREIFDYYSVLDSGHNFYIHAPPTDIDPRDNYWDYIWDVDYYIYGPSGNYIESGTLFNDLPDQPTYSHTELSGNQFLLATWIHGDTSITNQIFEVDPLGGLIPGPPNSFYADAQISENVAGEVVAILSAQDPDNHHLDLTYSIKGDHPNYRIDGNLLILDSPIVNPFDPAAFQLTVEVTDPDQYSSEFGVWVQPREVLLSDGSATPIATVDPYHWVPPVTLTEGLVNGNYAVAWNDNAAVYMQIFERDGNPLTVDPISISEIYTHSLNSLAELDNGNIIITYDSDQTDYHESYARIYSQTGQPVGGEILLTSTTRPNESSAVVAALTGGGFVAAWVSEPVGGTNTEIHFDIYNESGIITDSLYGYASSMPGNKQVAVAGLENGDFVMTYDVDPLDGGDTMVYARVFDVDTGTWANDEIELSQWYHYTEDRVNTHWNSQVTGLSDGGFAVIWEHTYTYDSGSYNDYSRVVTYAYQNGGYVNEYSYNALWQLDTDPVIDSFEDGFIIAGMYRQNSIDYSFYIDSVYTICAEVYDNDGQPVGYMVQVAQDGEFTWDPDGHYYNISTTSYAPDVTALDDGYFVVTYATMEDPTGYSAQTTVYSQQYIIDSPFNSFVKIEGDESANVLDGEVGMNSVMFGYGGNDILSGGAGEDFIDGGYDNDIIKGGEGVDTLIGGLGDDTFIIWGTWDPDYYIYGPTTDEVGDILPNENSTSHWVAGETIDGGDGSDTISTYGAITLSLDDTNISNVENLDTHSHVTIAADQFDQFGFSSITGEGEESHILSFTGEGVVDLTTLTIDNIDEINIESGVELVLTEEQEATLPINVVESQDTVAQLAEDSTDQAGTVEPIFGDDPSLTSETESVATIDSESTDDEPIFGDTMTSDPVVDSVETAEPLLADSGDDTAMDLVNWDSGTEEETLVDNGTDADALWLATQTEEIDAVV